MGAQMADDPVLCYFEAIRSEILAIKERIIKIMAIGITGVPILIGVGRNINLDILVITSPAITVVFTLMLLFEQAALMRAGRYIRLHLEPAMFPDKKTKGWEEFLEDTRENRYADKIFSVVAHVTFALYYIAGAVLSYTRIQAVAGEFWAWIAVAIFMGFFIVIFAAVFYMFPTGSKRSNE